MARKLGNIYSRSLISVKYRLNDNLPLFVNQYPDVVTSALKDAAKDAVDTTKDMVPYKPNDPNSSVHLRDSAKIQVYQNGRLGGTCFIQWQATNPRSGFHYGIVQEAGGTLNPPTTYRNYTTPGTGPGFMTQTWNVIQQLAPVYLSQASSDLIGRISVKK